MNNQTSIDFVDPERVRANLKAHLAKSAKIIQGKQIALHDGRLVLGFGDNRQIVPDGDKLRLTMGVDFARVGFVSWQGIKPAYRVSALYEGPPPELSSMPDRDPALWPLAKGSGKAYDPWSPVVLLLGLDTIGDFYTVTLSDWRSREEFQVLAEVYLNHDGDEFPEIELSKSTQILSLTRQVAYVEMKIVGWEKKQAFVDMMKPAGIKIASIAQVVTPKPKTEPSSSPPETELDDRWWDRQ
jgi:hypothetical protein